MGAADGPIYLFISKGAGIKASQIHGSAAVLATLIAWAIFFTPSYRHHGFLGGAFQPNCFKYLVCKS